MMSISPSKQKKLAALSNEGKQLAAEGKIRESLSKFEEAVKIFPTQKVLQRIEILKQSVKSNGLVAKKESSGSEMKHSSSSVSGGGDAKEVTCYSTAENLPEIKSEFKQDEVEKKLSKVKDLYKEARLLLGDQKLQDALELLEKAQSIYETDRVQKKIDKIKEYLESESLVTNRKSSSLVTKHELANSVIKRDSASTVIKQESAGLEAKHNGTLVSNSEETVHATDYSKAEKLHSVGPVQTLAKDSISQFKDVDNERKLSEVKDLYEEARCLSDKGKLNDALKLLEKAQSIYKTEKVQKKIDKIKEFLEDDSESNDRINIAEDFSLYHKIYNSLYPYQRDGVAWLWKLYKMRKGGVLADDMGLGKTFQVIAFLSGLIDLELVKHVLIVVPVSLLANWDKEFQKWCPGIQVLDFHGSSIKQRERNLLRVQKRGDVLLTSYGMVLNSVSVLNNLNGREFVWDYLILDEGHKIKNATKTTKAVYDIPSRNRLVLTGTPIQNNLKELWSLFDFVQQGTLLGSQKTFKMQYETPIIRSREKDATVGEKRLGLEMSENLKHLIKPFFLRRTKGEIWGETNKVDELQTEMGKLNISMPQKNDLILWTVMSEQQIEIYKSFLHSEAVKQILMTNKSPLVQLTVLKKICDHPRLLSQRACLQLGLTSDLKLEDVIEDESTTAPSIDCVSDEILLQESGKLKLAIALIEQLKESGSRMLFFSLSRKILDMVQRILINRKCKVMRLDGTVAKLDERERRIQKFQNDTSYSVFLLTTQVGGVGLTLTAADRVIIYDPSWNPATDAQAVDRIYRIGQTKNVVVYRLITCGTVEEKIYRRQIFKDSITRQTTGDTEPYRYFSKQELRELFSLGDPHYSVTQEQLEEMHSDQRKTDQTLTEHIEFLKTLNIFGISDHDLMFTKHVKDSTEDTDECAVSKDFIKKRVANAHELIKQEASIVAEGIRVAGTFNRPYQLPVVTKSISKSTSFYKPPVFPEEIDVSNGSKDIPVFETPVEIDLTGTKENKDIPVFKPPLVEIDLTEKDEENDISVSVTPSKEIELIENYKNKHISPSKTSIDKRNALNDSNRSNSSNSSVCSEDLDQAKNNEDEHISSIEASSENKNLVKVENGDSNEDDGSILLGPPKQGYACKENFKTYDDFQDFDDSFQRNTSYVKSCRVSCARKSGAFMSDNEDTTFDAEDSSGSASLSIVPDSRSNSPLSSKSPRSSCSISETPSPPPSPTVPELLAGKTEFCNFVKKHESSVEGITPLKVDRSLAHEDSSFVQAMATSIIISPESSPKQAHGKVLDVKEESDISFDSPIKAKKRKIRQIASDSEESESEDEESEYETGLNSVTDEVADVSDSETELENPGKQTISAGDKSVPNKEIEIASDAEESGDDEVASKGSASFLSVETSERTGHEPNSEEYSEHTSDDESQSAEYSQSEEESQSDCNQSNHGSEGLFTEGSDDEDN